VLVPLLPLVPLLDPVDLPVEDPVEEDDEQVLDIIFTSSTLKTCLPADVSIVPIT